MIVAFDQRDGKIIDSFCAEDHFNVRKSCSIVFRQALTLQHRGKRFARNCVLRCTKCHTDLKCELFGRELCGISTPALFSLRSVSVLAETSSVLPAKHSLSWINILICPVVCPSGWFEICMARFHVQSSDLFEITVQTTQCPLRVGHLSPVIGFRISFTLRFMTARAT